MPAKRTAPCPSPFCDASLTYRRRTRHAGVDGELYEKFNYWLRTNIQINGSVWIDPYPDDTD
jgi:hypothetical protein